MGESRLAGEIAEHVHAAGGIVLYGRCDEDLAAALQPFIEALRSLVPALGPTRVGRGTAWTSSPESCRSWPTPARPRPAVRADPDTERLALFDAVTNLMGAASGEAPVLIVLDDLHWAGKTTLSLLRHLLRAAKGARLLVVGTYHDTELARTHPLAETLADLRRGTRTPPASRSAAWPPRTSTPTSRGRHRRPCPRPGADRGHLRQPLLPHRGAPPRRGDRRHLVAGQPARGRAGGDRAATVAPVRRDEPGPVRGRGRRAELRPRPRRAGAGRRPRRRDRRGVPGRAGDGGARLGRPVSVRPHARPPGAVGQAVTVKRARLHKTIAELLENAPVGADPDARLADLAYHWSECASLGTRPRPWTPADGPPTGRRSGSPTRRPATSTAWPCRCSTSGTSPTARRGQPPPRSLRRAADRG